MIKLAAHHLHSGSHSEELKLGDPSTWHATMKELIEDNARLVQIITELLVKNQHLRCTLNHVASTQSIHTITQAPHDAA